MKKLILLLLLIPYLAFAGSTLRSDQVDIIADLNDGHTIQDEGSSLAERNNLNFVGAGVVCTDDSANDQTDCTIATGGSGYDTIQEEGSGLTQRSTVNFIGADITCVDNGGSTRTDCTVSGGGGGFDVITSPPTELQIWEEFIRGANVSPNIGTLGWSITLVSGFADFTDTDFQGHPGLFRLQSNATTNGGADLFLTLNTDPTDNFDSIHIIKVSTAVADTVIRVGYSANTMGSNTRPASGIYFEKLVGDTNWFAITRSSNTETRTDTTVAVSTTNFQRFRIRRVNGTTIGFTIDGGSEITHTTNISAVALRFVVGMIGTTTTNKLLSIDYYGLKVTGLSR